MTSPGSAKKLVHLFGQHVKHAWPAAMPSMFLAPKGREVVGGLEGGVERLGSDESPKRKPAADRLSETDEIRLGAVVVVREGLSGAAESGEDLVVDQRQTAVATFRL